MKSTTKDSVLFTPIKMGSLVIPNRFVRSATHDFMAADDGSITERQVTLYNNLSEGEVGLIISGHAYVNRKGKASPYQIGVDSDSMIDGLSKIADSVHRYSSRIFLQISHAGRQTNEKICGCTPVSPSAVYEPSFKIRPKEMTDEDIKNAVVDFISATNRARQAGFDGVQLHMAHGYLLSGFISPHTNRRNDEWGGTFTNRLRIIIEIIRGIRDLLGREYPLMVKLNSTDLLSSGISLDESIEIAKVLEQEGIDGIEVSGGMAEAGEASVWKGMRAIEDEGYYVHNASQIKSAVSVPISGLGGIRSFSVMEKIIAEGQADLISLSRPFIRDPYLVKKFRMGKIKRSECISCNACFNMRGISCSELKKNNRK